MRNICTLALRALALCTIAVALLLSAHSQTFSVIHNFTGGADGANPYSGLAMDQDGTLYGTTVGGSNGNGTVFQIKDSGAGYILNPLYRFRGGSDGVEPLATVTISSDESLYGTTAMGGTGNNGTVFNLRPPASICPSVVCPWTETVIYRFQGGSDGSEPNYGDLIFDSAGALYGVTIVGGIDNQGTVYKLTPSGNQWTESVIYTLTGGADGGQPFAGMVFDHAGNLVSTAQLGGINGFGTIYELAPLGLQWVQHTLYSFTGGSNDGGAPVSAPLVDGSDDLFGTTCGSSESGGTVFELSPMGGTWTFDLLKGFSSFSCAWSSLTQDNSGNFYGVTVYGGNLCSGLGCGTIYKLSPVTGGYLYTDLHDFDGTDGQNPYGRVVLDGAGNLYGTAAMGGSGGNCPSGCGVVWRLRQ